MRSAIYTGTLMHSRRSPVRNVFRYPLASWLVDLDELPELERRLRLLGVNRRAFVSFPNFAHWRVRLSLLWGGRMPVTRTLPHGWHDTPNIHHLSIADFRAFVKARGSHIEQAWFLSGDRSRSSAAANFRAEHAVFLLRR